MKLFISSFLSPAVRGRGLKHHKVDLSVGVKNVARRARAWVETDHPQAKRKMPATVARRARAWVETCHRLWRFQLPPSPAVRGRGLKLFIEVSGVYLFRRPPCAGVG